MSGQEKVTRSRGKGLIAVLIIVLVAAAAFGYYQFGYLASTAPRKVVEITIEIQELDHETHRFSPDTVNVPLGALVKLTVINRDEHNHGLTIPELGINTGLVAPDGGSVTIEFVAEKAGSFQFFCSIPGCVPDHDKMIGTFNVA